MAISGLPRMTGVAAPARYPLSKRQRHRCARGNFFSVRYREAVGLGIRGALACAAVLSAFCATACSEPKVGDRASAPATSSHLPTPKKQVDLTQLLPEGSLNFKPGQGVVAGTAYPHSLVFSCQSCLPVGQAGQQGQPGMEFRVPDGVDRLEFVAGLTDSSTETDRSAYIAVWAHAGNDLTKLFESSGVTVGAVIPVSVPVRPGNTIRIDGGGLNGNETLCVCNPKLVAT